MRYVVDVKVAGTDAVVHSETEGGQSETDRLREQVTALQREIGLLQSERRDTYVPEAESPPEYMA